MKKIFLLCLVLITTAHFSFGQLMVEVTHNTNCTSPNGSASASVGGVISGYNFEWYDETTAPVFNGPIVNNLSPGTYSVKVTDQANSEIGTAQFMIMDQVTMPEVTMHSVPNTACDMSVYNGEVSVTVNNADVASHAFQWYSGSNTNTVIVGAQTATLSQIPSGNYSVAVQNIATGCVTVKTDYVADAPAFPMVSINDIMMNTNCMGSPNGSLTANAAPGNLLFEWYAGMEVFGEALASGQTLEHLTQGTYTVKVTDMNTSCVGLATAELGEDCTITVVERINNTSCDMPNGSVSVSVAGETEGYIFEWYDDMGLPFHSGPVATDLSPGDYTVVVKNQSDLSELGTLEISILDQTIYPAITVEATANTACDDTLANGTAIVSISNGLADDHSFKWYAGIGTAGDVIGTTSTPGNMSAGDYTVTVKNLASGCVTMEHVVIEDHPHGLLVTVSSTDNTSCFNLPTGKLTANTEASGINYSFEWYSGPAAEGDILGTGGTLNSLEGGIYTVKVTAIASACDTIVTSQVDNNFTFPVATISVVNNTTCAPANGSLTVSTEGPAADYNFGWFEGTEFDGTYLGTEPSLNNLSSGVYSVVVSGGGAGCYTTLTGQVADECVVTANQTDPELRISYYPNPAKTNLLLRSGVHATVSLIDIKGTALLTQNIPSSDPVIMDLSGVKPGKYILRVTQERKTTSHPIIVE
jgi:hypothetical protein